MKLLGGLGAAVAAVALLLSPLRVKVTDVVLPPSDEVAYTAQVSSETPLFDSFVQDSLGNGSPADGLLLSWPAGSPSEECQLEMAPQLQLFFDLGTEPRKLEIYGGLEPEGDADESRLWPGPRVITVRGAGGCQRFEVGDSHTDIALSIGQVAAGGDFLVIQVHERFDDDAFAQNDVVAIAELRLLQ